MSGDIAEGWIADTSARPTLIFLHGLGCSARTWRPVIDVLGAEFDCVALDLPGHGDASQSDQLTVEQMTDWLTEELVVRRPTTWALVGHSMGGKMATLVTERADRGIPGLTRPCALVLVAPSPLEPEPMEESRRARMIEWCADGPVSEHDAREFVEANTAESLPDLLLASAVADVTRVHRVAWLAWLQRGSLEDWSGEGGPVRVPTLLVAGADDGDLGVDAQRRLTLPRVAANDVVAVKDAAHLIMLEQPATLAALVARHVRAVLADRKSLPADTIRLIASDRVSARTRAALLQRVPDPIPVAAVLTADQRVALTALLHRVVPQRDTDIDLTSRVEARLASGTGDGWRFAELPADPEAWRRGLDTLTSVIPDFQQFDTAGQDAVLHRLVRGEIGSPYTGHLTSEQMTLWFEDVRAEAVRAWLSHPAALARIGYDGYANGGDGVRRQGYLLTGAGERESWQPAVTGARSTAVSPAEQRG